MKICLLLTLIFPLLGQTPNSQPTPEKKQELFTPSSHDLDVVQRIDAQLREIQERHQSQAKEEERAASAELKEIQERHQFQSQIESSPMIAEKNALISDHCKKLGATDEAISRHECMIDPGLKDKDGKVVGGTVWTIPPPPKPSASPALPAPPTVPPASHK